MSNVIPISGGTQVSQASKPIGLVLPCCVGRFNNLIGAKRSIAPMPQVSSASVRDRRATGSPSRSADISANLKNKVTKTNAQKVLGTLAGDYHCGVCLAYPD